MTGWCLWCVALAAAAPDSGEQDLLNAQELMLAQDYEGAVPLYISLLERGFGGKDLWWNLGVAFESSERKLSAIVAYETAGHRYGDAAAVTRLETLRKAMNLPQQEVGPPGVWVKTSLRQTLGWVTAVLSLLSAAAFLVGRYRKVFFGPLAGSFFALGAAYGGSYLLRPSPRAVVVQATKMRAGPDQRLPAETNLSPGQGLFVLGPSGRFVEVKDGAQRTGFVEAEHVLLLPARHTSPVSWPD